MVQAWTEIADLNTARNYYLEQVEELPTAAIAEPEVHQELQIEVESWNGSSWTEVTDLNHS